MLSKFTSFQWDAFNILASWWATCHGAWWGMSERVSFSLVEQFSYSIRLVIEIYFAAEMKGTSSYQV
jgi:hypothetical protein